MIQFVFVQFETEVDKLRNENNRLQNELVVMKRKIEDLEGHIRQVEEDNSLLRELNEIFGIESDKVYKRMKFFRKNSIDIDNFAYLEVLLVRPDTLKKC